MSTPSRSARACALTALLALTGASCITSFDADSVELQARAEAACGDGLDDDGDGLIDCRNSDCRDAAACQEALNCGDGLDNDLNGRTDCDDLACAGTAACREICDDGVDNDVDGDADCDDTECSAACRSDELCANGQDDDADGLADCDDPDCAALIACQLEICDDATDNDRDGLIDCFDDECAASPACARELTCDDGADNDADGQADCDDDDCADFADCQPQVELCANGQDDDGDGDTDCDDTDCANAHVCIPEVCANGQDDDGDGDIDCDDDECPGPLAFELCDGFDNNCDGRIDEPSGAAECNAPRNAEAVGCANARCDFACLEGFRDANGDLNADLSDGCECAFLTCAEQLGVCAGAELVVCDGAPLPNACPNGLYQLHAQATSSARYEANVELSCDGADNDCDGEADELCCSTLTPALVPNAYPFNATLFKTALASPFTTHTVWVTSEMEGIPGDVRLHIDDPFDQRQPDVIAITPTTEAALQVAIAPIQGASSAVAFTQLTNNAYRLNLMIGVSPSSSPAPVVVAEGDGDDFDPVLGYRAEAINPDNRHVVALWRREDTLQPSPYSVRVARYSSLDPDLVERYTLATLDAQPADLSLALGAADASWGGVAAWGTRMADAAVHWVFSGDGALRTHTDNVAERPHPSVAVRDATSALMVYSARDPVTERVELARMVLNAAEDAPTPQPVFAAPRQAPFARFPTLYRDPSQDAFWLAWYEADEDMHSAPSTLWLAKLDADGAPLIAPVRIATLADNTLGFSDFVDVVANTSHVVVTYTTKTNPIDSQDVRRIHQARLDTQGNPICPD